VCACVFPAQKQNLDIWYYGTVWYRSGNFQMSAQQYWFLTVGGEVQQVKSGVISQEGNQVCVFLSHGTMNPKISENHDLDSSDCIHFTDRSHMTQNWPQKLQKWHGFSFGSRKKCPTNSRFQKETHFTLPWQFIEPLTGVNTPKLTDGANLNICVNMFMYFFTYLRLNINPWLMVGPKQPGKQHHVCMFKISLVTIFLHL